MRGRVFKTAWFSRAATKARIADIELCKAIEQVILGQADDLGGGVYKKRIGLNAYRSIILAKGKNYWVFEYLYAKKNRANIDSNELRDFRAIATAYASLSVQQIERLLADRDFTEICNDGRKKI